MKMKVKPAIVPTLVSARAAVWSSVLIALFLALVSLNLARIRAREAEASYRRPVETPISGSGLATSVPRGWKAYRALQEEVCMYKRLEGGFPQIEIEVQIDSRFTYCALDQNPVIIARRIAEELREEAPEKWANPTVVISGTEIVPVKPGIAGVHFAFFVEEFRGEGLFFYVGDRKYLIWGIASEEDAVARDEIHDYISRPFSTLVLPDLREDIDRPVVHSGRLTAADNRRVLEAADREFAMWELFSERAASEPASALLPAIQHFREALRLLATIRQEASLLGKPDFANYRKLCEIRQRTVKEWFVMLDKYKSMGDVERVRSQAKFICDHATLQGEAQDARRAIDVLMELGKDEGK